MVQRCTRRSLSNYFDMTSYHWNVRQNTVTWHCWMNGKNDVTSCTKCSLPQEYWTNFDSTFVVCLKVVSIEMLDKLITYIACWNKTLYQVLPVAWTNRITTRRSDSIVVHIIGSIWHKILYQHTMYVIGIYLWIYRLLKYSHPPLKGTVNFMTSILIVSGL